MRLAFAAALALWGAVAAAQDALPEAYPPKMGEIRGTFRGAPAVWETFDFSVGAFDASAWADRRGGASVRLHLMGYAPGNPDEKSGRLLIEAGIGKALRPGMAQSVEVSYLKEAALDGPRLTSKDQKARLVIESIGPKVENSYSRRVTGWAHAQLCAVDWPDQGCPVVKVRFDTEVQIDGDFPIQP